MSVSASAVTATDLVVLLPLSAVGFVFDGAVVPTTPTSGSSGVEGGRTIF